MMTAQEELSKLRPELRYPRIRVSQLQRVHSLQKQKTDQLEDLLKEKDKYITKLEQEKQKLEEELDKTKRERDTYKGMVFKEKRNCLNPSSHASTERKQSMTKKRVYSGICAIFRLGSRQAGRLHLIMIR